MHDRETRIRMPCRPARTAGHAVRSGHGIVCHRVRCEEQRLASAWHVGTHERTSTASDSARDVKVHLARAGRIPHENRALVPGIVDRAAILIRIPHLDKPDADGRGSSMLPDARRASVQETGREHLPWHEGVCRSDSNSGHVDHQITHPVRPPGGVALHVDVAGVSRHRLNRPLRAILVARGCLSAYAGEEKHGGHDGHPEPVLHEMNTHSKASQTKTLLDARPGVNTLATKVLTPKQDYPRIGSLGRSVNLPATLV